MGDIRKNKSYQNGCTGNIVFNPDIITDKVTIALYNSNAIYDVYNTIIDTGLTINVGDQICFGGQFCAEVESYNDATGELRINIPDGTFPEYGSRLDINDYINNYDYLYIFNHTNVVNNSISNVSISNYSNTVKRKSFGYHSQQYDELPEYKATLLIEPDVEKTKIDQMLSSEFVAFFTNDDVYSTDSLPTGWVFNKPHGGGSLNPEGRKITIKDDAVKYSYRRGYQPINVIFEG
jgi:hypothetical protein